MSIIGEINDVIGQLDQTKRTIVKVKDEIRKKPEVSHVGELVDACETIELYYKQLCYDCTEDYEDQEEVYKRGINIEFYIEAQDWHKISRALRKLRELKQE